MFFGKRKRKRSWILSHFENENTFQKRTTFWKCKLILKPILKMKTYKLKLCQRGIYSFSGECFDKIWLIRASLCFKSVVQLMTNDSIELHTKASSSMIVKVEEVFFPSSSSMAMAMWFEENLNDVCSSLLANDDHTTLHSPVYI